MSRLVFRLRNVPDDESDAVRALMDEHEFDWYETTAGNWGIAMPGIWVRNANDAPLARSLIETYQQHRSDTMRRDYESQRRAGRAPTLMHKIRQQPLRVMGIVAFCLFILFVSINPFLQLIGYTK